MIIFRYLTKQILSLFLTTSLVLLMIFVSNQFIHYLNDAASGKITIHAVLMVTAVQLPMLLGYILLLGLFLSILLTLGRLYADHEMVVLSACGVSRAQITKMIFVIALLATVLDAWLMLWVEPQMFRLRTEIVAHSVQTATLDKVLPGRFQSLGDDQHVLYMGEVDKHTGRFADVFAAMHDPHKPPGSWMLLTSDAVQEKTVANNGDFFVFNHGFRYSGNAGDRDFQKITVSAILGAFAERRCFNGWALFSDANDRACGALFNGSFGSGGIAVAFGDCVIDVIVCTVGGSVKRS